MKAIWQFLIFFILVLFISGCGEEVERENPLDAENERTGGAPPGLKARAGDGQVTLSWPNLGIDGVSEYRIYRAHRASTPDQFQLVASVPAMPTEEEPEYKYTDTGLQNDDDNVYFYRLSYLDSEGSEVPDPSNSSERWFLIDIIPSKAPPVPSVEVIEDEDLQVRLVWEGYVDSAPEDLAGFRVYSAPKAEEGQEQEPFTLLASIEDPRVEFYIDANDYPNSVIRFRQDGITRLYQVAAFDKVDVESDAVMLEGTSPNLPPSPPPQVKGRFLFDINTYDVRIEWRRNLEPDAIGYVIYAIWPDEEGKIEFKKKIDDPNETVATISDRYVAVEGFPLPKQYYVTAFDNTPKPDGKRDESAPSVILSGI
jgi:hypothetical protein